MQFHLALTLLTTLLPALTIAGNANHLILCKNSPAICKQGAQGSTWMACPVGFDMCKSGLYCGNAKNHVCCKAGGQGGANLPAEYCMG
ncbi:hypothetical protein EG328_000631 [Venturia inaequalis]|uniref:Uncharacterized protein n=1 Tax=Venturia inaequalis TaxID=5025 RepID=A0A8H3V2A4_VENIN|nr:hypothetical protein EG328_000631 [Venturia inaequalis]RDI82965.1 hypothetical protein Vi05172_g6821 [Venturia inaequalis]